MTSMFFTALTKCGNLEGADFLRKKIQYAGQLGPAPNNFLQGLLELCRTGNYKILKFKRNR
jgi:hypothetical protein